jgi:heterodisulfide reductase subunit C
MHTTGKHRSKIDKSFLYNKGMVKNAGDIVSLYRLASCTGCRKCDGVCPSGRNGGMFPYTTLSVAINAPPASSLPELQTDVWKCLMCHRCSSACHSSIDITGVIRTLRYDSASSGEHPKRFRMASAALGEQGRTFPVNSIVNKKRSELGLDIIAEDPVAINELRIIMDRTGFCNE